MNERDAREEIVRYCRLLWKRRLVTGTSGNVSLRLPGGDALVTPASRSLRDLSPGELVSVDAQGRSRSEDVRPTSELPLHLAAYEARGDVAAVVHTHPTFCVLWSKTGRVFPRDTVGARETLGAVAFAPYAPPGSRELAQAAAAAFREGAEVVLMERHGISAASATLEEAFSATDLAEEAARIAFFSQFLDRPIG